MTTLTTEISNWKAKGAFKATEADIKNIMAIAGMRDNEHVQPSVWGELDELLEANTDLDKKDRAKLIQRAKICSILGDYPYTAAQLCDLWFERYALTCRYNGTIESTVQTIALADGTRVELDAGALNDPRQLRQAAITRADVNEATLGDDIYLFTREWSSLKAMITQTDIKVALTVKINNCRAGRLGVLYKSIDGEPSTEVHPDLLAYVTRNFVIDSTVTPDFVAAVLLKFIHQVKSKMLNREVTWHLMPVLLGKQGIGKSTFVSTMCGPLKELIRAVPFDEIADSRTTREIARTPIVLVDEMAGAKKAEMSKVKQLITAEDTDTRVLGTNAMVKSKVRTTFIGTANEEMDQLIRDKTGNRRFVGIRMVDKPDWSLTVDWKAVWQSVDVNVDPIIPHAETLIAVQSGQRSLTNTEVWFNSFDGSDEHFERATSSNEWLTPMELHGVFREWEKHHNGNPFPTDFTTWNRQFAALLKDRPCFDKQNRTAKRTVHYRYNEATPTLAVVRHKVGYAR